MNFTNCTRQVSRHLLACCLIVFSTFSITTADIIQPGVPVLADPQLQACLDEAVIAAGWTTTEEVTSLVCADRGVVDLGGIDILINLTELDVSNNQIVSLSPLPQLQALDLSNNQLLDTYPLDQQTELRQLNLSGNTRLQPLQVQTIVYNNPQLTHLGVGGIAFGDISWLPATGPMGEYDLVELDVSNTGLQVDGLYPVSNYPNLRVLEASDNHVEFLPFLPQLQALDLSNNQLLDTYPLDQQTELRQLNLSGNTRLQPLQVQTIVYNNPQLTHLGVGGIAFGDISWLPATGPMGEYDLVELDVSNTGLQVDGLYPVSNYPNLRVLEASDNHVEFLPFLPQLQALDLSNNQLLDTYPLDQQTELRQLNLSGNTRLQPLQVQTIVYNNPQLTHLGVGGIAFGDISWLPATGPMGEYDLVELDVSSTGLQVDGLYPVSNYPNLRVLDASDNHVEFLPFLPQLQALDLSNNQLLDTYPLDQQTELRQLNLSGNTRLQPLQVQTIVYNNPQLTHLGVGGIAFGDISWLPATGPMGEYDLVELDVSSTGLQVDGLYPVSNYPNLRVLDASDNHVEFLPFLPQLQALDLSNNQLLDTYPLDQQTELRQLNLSGNTRLQPLQVQTIVYNNPQLTHLGVGGIAFGDISWLPATGPMGEYDLVELDVSSTGLQVDGLYPVSNYPNLRVLDASDNHVEFLPFLPQLQALDLSNNQLLDTYPLDQQTELRQLNLSGNTRLQPLQVQTIVYNNPQLTHLGVGGIAFGDISWLPATGPMGEYDLVELDVSSTGIIDLGAIAGTPNLRVLDASDNLLMDMFPLDQLNQLHNVNLSDNDIRFVVIPGDISDLISLNLLGNNNIQCADLDGLEAQLAAGVLVRPETCIIFNAPEVLILSPIDSGLFYETTIIQFTAYANDIEDGDLGVAVQWSSNLDGLLGAGDAVSQALSAGAHTITASVTDSHGNTSSSTVSITVLPNTAPQIDILSPSSSSVFNEGDSVMFAATASDAEDGILDANIIWTSSLDGALGSGATLTTVLSVGVHTITAAVTDSAEATSTRSVNLTVNGIPQLTLQSPSAGSLFMLGEVVGLKAIATDVEDGNISTSIQWSSNIDGILGTGNVLTKTLSLGNHDITATITDSAGAVSSATTQIIIDQIDLTVTQSMQGNRPFAELNWSGSRTLVDIYQDGLIVGVGEASGTAEYRYKGQTAFKVCESGTEYCSVEITIQ